LGVETVESCMSFASQLIPAGSSGPPREPDYRGAVTLFALPLVTLKIVAAIHWEALRLWLKGARLVPRPHAAGANIAFDTHYQLGDRQTRRL
jgi:hypothetical protein